jgi:hypothetical protein
MIKGRSFRSRLCSCASSPTERSTLMNDENYIGLDVHQATNPKKALGHEPQRDPWLTPYIRWACPVSELIRRGWMSPNAPCLPVEGEVFFLTSPFRSCPCTFRRKSRGTLFGINKPRKVLSSPGVGRRAHGKLTARLKQNAGGAGLHPSQLRGPNARLRHRRPPARESGTPCASQGPF